MGRSLPYLQARRGGRTSDRLLRTCPGRMLTWLPPQLYDPSFAPTLRSTGPPPAPGNLPTPYPPHLAPSKRRHVSVGGSIALFGSIHGGDDVRDRRGRAGLLGREMQPHVVRALGCAEGGGGGRVRADGGAPRRLGVARADALPHVRGAPLPRPRRGDVEGAARRGHRAGSRH